MNFAFLKKAPKIFLVAGVLIGSTVMFWMWWHFRAAAHNRNSGTPVAQIEKRVAVDFAANLENYFMAGDDLYDAVAGQLVAKNFLNGANPLRLVYEPESKKLVGVFANGFVRFGLDGKKEAELLPAVKAAFTPDAKTMVYAKDGDVWAADLDLVQFKFLNNHKVTAIGQFDDSQNFADNILLLTHKYALWGIGNRHARIDLETGAVKPMQVQLLVNQKTRSPDSTMVVGIFNGQFMSYDFDSDRGNSRPIGRGSLSDAQWLDTNRCVILVNRNVVGLFDRRQEKPENICVTPFPVRWLAEPSPSNRYVFCGGDNGVGLVDLETKFFIPLGADSQSWQGCVWLDGENLLCSWEGLDTDRRGTWLKNPVSGETRITDEPFLIANNSPLVVVLKEAGLAVFQTRKGLQKIKLDGSGRQSFSPSSAEIFSIKKIQLFSGKYE
jgi:hypothetical protein